MNKIFIGAQLFSLLQPSKFAILYQILRQLQIQRVQNRLYVVLADVYSDPVITAPRPTTDIDQIDDCRVYIHSLHGISGH